MTLVVRDGSSVYRNGSSVHLLDQRGIGARSGRWPSPILPVLDAPLRSSAAWCGRGGAQSVNWNQYLSILFDLSSNSPLPLDVDNCAEKRGAAAVACGSIGERPIMFALKIVGLWVLLSCTLGPCLTWL